MTKLADDQSGSLNSVMVCSNGSVNAEWLVNLHTGARFHVLHFHPRTIPKQYGLMRPQRVDATTPVLRNVVGFMSHRDSVDFLTVSWCDRFS